MPRRAEPLLAEVIHKTQRAAPGAGKREEPSRLRHARALAPGQAPHRHAEPVARYVPGGKGGIERPDSLDAPSGRPVGFGSALGVAAGEPDRHVLNGERVPVLEPGVADPLERHAKPRRDALERLESAEVALREPVDDERAGGRRCARRGNAPRRGGGEHFLDHEILRAALDLHGGPSGSSASADRAVAARFDEGETARHSKRT